MKFCNLRAIGYTLACLLFSVSASAASVKGESTMLTADGRAAVKKDFVDSKEHAKEIVQAGKDVVNTELGVQDFAGRVNDLAQDRQVLAKTASNTDAVDKLRGDQAAKGSQEGAQTLSDKLAQAGEQKGSAQVLLYQGNQVATDDTRVNSTNDFNKNISNSGYNAKSDQTVINTAQVNMTDATQVVQAVAHENARRDMSTGGTGSNLGATDQTTLASTRGQRAAETFTAYADLNNQSTQGSSTQAQWNADNANSATIQTGNAVVAKMDSKEVKPWLSNNKLKDEEGELLKLKKQKESGQCDTSCNNQIQKLETLDKTRDEQIAPLIDACEKAGRNNCKGEAIAQSFAKANGFGAEAMKRESNPGTQGSPFSFNNCPGSDKGGCSYGPLQIAADTGMMQGFIDELRKNPSAEAQSFYKDLQAAGGLSAAQNKDPAFIQTWMKLTAKDPQFVQYQIDALVNRNLYPVVQELQKVGVDFNTLSQAQKDALFSAAVQHGAGTESKTKGADNVLERTISVAQTDSKPPVFCSSDPCPAGSVRPLPTYTRQELVYGEVENQMRTAEETQAKLVRQREGLITQREGLITQQLQLERQKSQLLEQGLNSDANQLQSIKNQAAVLDKRINTISAQVNEITGKVDSATQKVNAQNQYIEDARQYLKSQAQGSFADGEQWLKDFYQQRTQMYPKEANRYKQELDSLLMQYRAEQKSKNK